MSFLPHSYHIVSQIQIDKRKRDQFSQFLKMETVISETLEVDHKDSWELPNCDTLFRAAEVVALTAVPHLKKVRKYEERYFQELK